MALRAEFSGRDHPVGREIERITGRLVKRCGRLIDAGRKDGSIPPGPPARTVARALVGAVEGAVIELAGQAPHDDALAGRATAGVLGLDGSEVGWTGPRNGERPRGPDPRPSPNLRPDGGTKSQTRPRVGDCSFDAPRAPDLPAGASAAAMKGTLHGERESPRAGRGSLCLSPPVAYADDMTTSLTSAM